MQDESGRLAPDHCCLLCDLYYHRIDYYNPAIFEPRGRTVSASLALKFVDDTCGIGPLSCPVWVKIQEHILSPFLFFLTVFFLSVFVPFQSLRGDDEVHPLLCFDRFEK